MVSSQSSRSSLVRRGVLAAAERLLRRVALAGQSPLGKLAVASLRGWARRWPTLSRLLGIEPSAAASSGVARAPATRSRAECLATLRVSDDPRARARAARDLARVMDDEASRALVAALRDPVAEVAIEAAGALRAHPMEKAAAALTEVLVNRDGYFSPVARAAAIRSLGAMVPSGQGAAIAAAVADGDATVSLAAIATLAERGEETGAAALLRLLEDGRGFYLPITRQAAARALSQMKLTDDGRLSALLQHESDETVRAVLSPSA
jgi:HEAT repeat protein